MNRDPKFQKPTTLTVRKNTSVTFYRWVKRIDSIFLLSHRIILIHDFAFLTA